MYKAIDSAVATVATFVGKQISLLEITSKTSDTCQCPGVEQLSMLSNIANVSCGGSDVEQHTV